MKYAKGHYFIAIICVFYCSLSPQDCRGEANFTCNNIALSECIDLIKRKYQIRIIANEKLPETSVSVSSNEVRPEILLSLALNDSGLINYTIEKSGTTLKILHITNSSLMTTISSDKSPSSDLTDIDTITDIKSDKTPAISLDEEIVIGDEIITLRQALQEQNIADQYAPPPDAIVFSSTEGAQTLTTNDLKKLLETANSMPKPQYNLDDPKWYESADKELKQMMEFNTPPPSQTE